MSWRKPVRGREGAPILVVCDAPSREASLACLPMSGAQSRWLGSVLREVDAAGPRLVVTFGELAT